MKNNILENWIKLSIFSIFHFANLKKKLNWKVLHGPFIPVFFSCWFIQQFSVGTCLHRGNTSLWIYSTLSVNCGQLNVTLPTSGHSNTYVNISERNPPTFIYMQNTEA